MAELSIYSTMCCNDGKLRARLASESKAGGWDATAMELAQRIKLPGSRARASNATDHHHALSHCLLLNKPDSKRNLNKIKEPTTSKDSAHKQQSCDVCAHSWTDCYVTWHVTCRQCGVSVHADCYCPSLEAATVSRWQCERCKEGVPHTTCCSLCGECNGAMKRMHSANSNLWAHVRCTAKASSNRLATSC